MTYPFKFLDAYNKEDTGIFFGRDEEINALYEMVFQSPILLVYGASGTGKTSLIQCGLASKFQSHDWLALTIRRGNDINLAFEKVLANAEGDVAQADNMDWLNEVMDNKEEESISKEISPLEKSLKSIYRNSFRPLYLIFDQFEELFILGSKTEQQQFIKTVKEILQVEQPVKMIFSLREEYLGYLNGFEREVPQLLRKKLRVEPMTLDKVKQVIIGATSFKDSNVRLQAGETDAIAEDIFDKIKGDDKTLTIQLPYLQVFLDKFYLAITHDETRKSEAIFTEEALRKIGDIGDVLRNFLEEQVIGISKKLQDQFPGISTEITWNMLSPFATLEGTKEPITKTDLYNRLPDQNRAMIDATVEAFINSRILRYSDETGTYEIAHDSLAERIAEKRSDEEIAILEIKRLIKSQVLLKADARELFSEKQINFIEPYLEKLRLTDEENVLIQQSYDAIAKHKAEEKLHQEAENRHLRERQELLEKNHRAQKRFISWISIALLGMIGLTIWAYKQKKTALSEKETNQTLLISNYRNNAESAKSENNFLNALFFTVEAISYSNDKDIIQDMLIDMEAYLPFYCLKNIMKHNDWVQSAVFSIDGKRILTACDDSIARQWDAVTGKQIGTDLKHHGEINTVVYSPDGTRILTASDDGTAQLWDASNCRKIGNPLQHYGAVSSAFFNYDGSRVITASGDSTARMWDAASGIQIGHSMKHHGELVRAVFSPDGLSILTTSIDQTARLWSVATCNQIGPDMKHNGIAMNAVFSADGKQMLTTSNDGNARLWDATTCKQIGPDMKHDDEVRTAVFSPDGKWILTASFDKTARLWDASTGKQAGPAMRHNGGVRSAVFSPDGKWILTASDDKTARIWDASNGTLAAPFLKHDGGVRSAVFSRDGKQIITTSEDKTARVWSAVIRNQTATILNHNDTVRTAVFSPDGRQVLTASADKTARVWDATSGKQIYPDLKHDSVVMSALYSPDGKWILTASSDKTARIWDAENGKQKGPVLKHDDVVQSAVFSPDGKRIVTTSNKTARIWDATNGNAIGTAMRHDSIVTCARFSPDGKRIVTSGMDMIARLWDAENGKQVGPNMKTEGIVRDVVFSPDGKWILTASDDKTARLWDAANGKQIGAMSHDGVVTRAIFSLDGHTILTGSYDMNARLWNAESHTQIGPNMRTNGVVISVVFSADGKWILTAGDDKTARMWELGSGRQIGPDLKHEGVVMSAVFSADGQHILTAGGDRTARLWDLNADLDIPFNLIKLQAQVTTGCELNIETGNLQVIPAERWYKLKEDYIDKAAEHYKNCKYKKTNFWARNQAPGLIDK